MSERAPEAVLWDVLRGAMMTRALGIVCELDVANALADGPRHVDDLAGAAGIPTDTLYRVLRALASDGVFAEDTPHVFRNTDVSDRLRDASWSSFAQLFGDLFYRAIGDLGRAVREDRATFADTLGSEFWSWLKQHPHERAQFDRAMAGNKERDASRLDELDWRDGEVVVDLGGGNGALLRELLRRRPALRGIVYDLPEAVRDETTFPDNLEFVEGSFFDGVPRGDTYVTSAILHDWNDDRAAAILRTVRSNAGNRARFLALESVVPAGNEPSGAKWLDLLMLVISGRERTEPEWRALFESNGFQVESIENGLIQARCR